MKKKCRASDEKPNKANYSKSGRYRLIKLLDVVGKGLERVVVGRLQRCVQKGAGGEQFGARKNRRSIEGVLQSTPRRVIVAAGDDSAC